MKIKPIQSYIYLLISLLVVFSSCEDRLDLSRYDIPDGSGDMTAVISFSDLASASIGGSRSSGTEIETINELFIAIYNTDGDLMKTVYLTPSTNTSADNSPIKDMNWELRAGENEYPGDGIERPEGDSDMDWADNDDKHTTPRVSFTLKDMPFGRYRMYVAANVGDLTGRDEIKTEKGLKSISYNWDYDHIDRNNQMFGYFTEMNNQKSTGFEAPTLIFTPENKAIHAWIRRLASKVTIAYDPRGLKDDVTIYIHSVTLHDIPKSCYLGQANPQWSDTDEQQGVHPLALYNRKDCDLVGDETGSEGGRVANSYFNYDRDGIADGEVDGSNPFRGIMLRKGYVGGAAVEPNSVIQGSTHKYNADALYFYENMQGEYKDIPRFNKEQQEKGEDDGVGTNITKPGTNPDGTTNDYKDRVPYGTYIEVDAYYVSKNLENPSQGPIKYRFMLGKNTTYNYDAQRNHHFKLTLGFNGWANQPDWHIEYEQPDPGIELPDTWNISYLYNQRSMLPIKINGDCVRLEVEITMNNWAPYYDPNYKPENWPPAKGTKIWPNGTVYSTPAQYQFVWLEQAMRQETYGTKTYPALNGWDCPEAGFLALLVKGDEPEDIKPSIFADEGKEYDFHGGTDALAAVREIYKKQYIRIFVEEDLALDRGEDGKLIGKKHTFAIGDQIRGLNNSYQINPVEDTKGVQDPNQRVLVLPLWTRNKDIILNSGFSGSNPYEAFPRVANIKVTATFREKNGKNITLPPANCRVIQGKRLANPKGIWREAGTTGDFHVQLMELDGTNVHSNYTPIWSDGTWKAYVSSNDYSFFSLETGGYEFAKKISPKEEGGSDTIKGESGSNVDFVINFKGIGSGTKCAVITVEYNGEQSFHKIMIRQGYENPITMGGSQWSSYSVYGAKARTGGGYDVDLTTKPLALGSLFRREKVNQPILVENNDTYGPNIAPNNGPMKIYNHPDMTWGQIGSDIVINSLYYNYNHYNGNNYGNATANSGNGNGTSLTNSIGLDINGNITGTNTSWKNRTISLLKGRSMGLFYSDDYIYRVPTFTEFQKMAEGCEYGFGVMYGDAATETATEWDMATGFQNSDNDPTTEPEELMKGTRGVITYNPKTGDQILFPVGKYGMGRRRQFNVAGAYSAPFGYNNRGILLYSDMNGLMPVTDSNDNWFRPVAYNMVIDPGAVYWIDKWVGQTEGEGEGEDKVYPIHDTFGWDINYMNLDFNCFSDNNALDACPIKLIIVGKNQ